MAQAAQTMTAEEKTKRFILLRAQLEVMAKLAESLDVEPFLEDLHMFDSVGCILDPTAYRNNLGRAELFRSLAQAAQKFKASALQFLRDAQGQISPRELMLVEYVKNSIDETLYTLFGLTTLDRAQEAETTGRDDTDPGINDPD